MSSPIETEFKTYLFRYFHDGSWWQFEIPATSPDDAQARIRKLPLAKLDGELVARIPASAGIFARVFCWLHNVLFWRKDS